jgi:uncharacterized protein (DUF2147 family)
MFYRLSAFAIMAGLVAATPANAQTTVPTGTWTNANREVIVRVSPCQTSTSTFCGTIVQDNRPGPAANPPNHMLIRDLRSDRQGWRGQINDGGMQLGLTMRMRDQSNAQVRYCLAFACETETWSRITTPNDINPPSRR